MPFRLTFIHLLCTDGGGTVVPACARPHFSTIIISLFLSLLFCFSLFYSVRFVRCNGVTLAHVFHIRDTSLHLHFAGCIFFFLVLMLLCEVSISLGSIQFRPGECVMSFNERHYYEIYWCGSSLELYGSRKDPWPERIFANATILKSFRIDTVSLITCKLCRSCLIKWKTNCVECIITGKTNIFSSRHTCSAHTHTNVN